MKKLVFCLVVVGLLASCSPAAEPTRQPTARPTPQKGTSRRFDQRTEEYLNLLAQTSTGAELVQFVRTTNDLSDLKIVWIDFPEESETDGHALTRGADKAALINLAANRLADPTKSQPSDVEMAYGTLVLAHEITHIVLADYFSQPHYTGEFRESLTELVEAKISTELFNLLKDRSIDYYQMLEQYDNIPDEPWSVTEQFEAMGVELLDTDLAKRILWLPEPSPEPTPSLESEFLELLLALRQDR